jgi:uncharacterized protein DUF5666
MDHDPVSGADAHPSDPSGLASPWGPESAEPKAPQRPPGRGQAGWTKKVGLGAAAVGLAGGAFGIVWAVTSGSGSTSSATSAPAAASQSASSSDSAQSLADPGQPAAGPGQGGPERFGFGFRGPVGGAEQNGRKPTPGMAGTVKSVSGSTVTIQDVMGFTRTIRTTGSTTYTRGGQSANRSAVTNGAEIAAQGTVDKNGTDLDASKVAVLLPRVTGTVQSVSGQSFVVQGADGAKHTVTTTGSTTFRQGRSQGSLSDVKQGVRVVAMGDRQSNGDLTASSVQIVPARLQHPPNGGPPAPPGGGTQSGSTT